MVRPGGCFRQPRPAAFSGDGAPAHRRRAGTSTTAPRLPWPPLTTSRAWVKSWRLLVRTQAHPAPAARAEFGPACDREASRSCPEFGLPRDRIRPGGRILGLRYQSQAARPSACDGARLHTYIRNRSGAEDCCEGTTGSICVLAGDRGDADCGLRCGHPGAPRLRTTALDLGSSASESAPAESADGSLHSARFAEGGDKRAARMR
jgi:hypothetical protein